MLGLVYEREMGGVFVDVFGEQVFHGCGVKHGGAGFVEVGGGGS